MSDDPERYLSLRQTDQARTDFAIIEDRLEAIFARVGRSPRRESYGEPALSGCWRLLRAHHDLGR
jgi:hypothetical protein